MDMIERSTSLESIPKDLLLKLQNYRPTRSECKRTQEDSEVEQCLRDSDNSPPSPKSTLSDDVFIKYPSRHLESDELEEKRSVCSYGYQPLVSPQPERETYSLYNDHPDWMMAERMQSRSPPVSPNHGNRFQGNVVRLSPLCDKNRVQSPLDRTPVKFRSLSQSMQHDVDPMLNRTPIKPSPASKEGEYGRQTAADVSPIPVPQDKLYVKRSPLTRPLVTGGSMPVLKTETRSSSPYAMDINDPRVHSPAYYHQKHAQYMEELSRRGGAKKQLFFEVPYGRACSTQDQPDHTDGYDAMCYSPRKGRFRASSDSDLAASLGDNFDDEDSRLISKFLVHLNKRKRKMSDRYESDYEDEAVIQAKRKRKELERRMNMNYLKQLEADVSMLNNKLRQPEPRPENCSCAIMEKQFLQMAENAYKNIRRQDASADGFAQFRKELNETNEILKESLEVMQNMRDMCEHRQLLRNLT